VNTARKLYPLNESQPYPFNQWWVAAYSSEIGRTLIQKTILNQTIVMYRTEAGEAVALNGLCPHRLYPLAKGQLVGDSIQCGYHGFTYDRTGRCTHIPSQPQTPPRFTTHRYPLLEHGGLVWIWTGSADPQASLSTAALESIGIGASGWAIEQHAPVTFKARYQLLIENLLDLSHISFVHRTSIPGGGSVAHIPCEIIETETSLNVRRVGRGLANNPHLQFLFPDHNGPVDQCFDTEYFGPHLIRTGGAISSAATDSESVRRLGTTNFIHAITPATPTTVHYFVITARDFRIDENSIGRANLGMGAVIQPEDIAILESIEVNVDEYADTRREFSSSADAGAIRVRRRLAAQIRAEQGFSPT
jgi:phenylpropionate dioxygenase-like ring-hydroxylating dioxygenase large terminal subunit